MTGHVVGPRDPGVCRSSWGVMTTLRTTPGSAVLPPTPKFSEVPTANGRTPDGVDRNSREPSPLTAPSENAYQLRSMTIEGVPHLVAYRRVPDQPGAVRARPAKTGASRMIGAATSHR